MNNKDVGNRESMPQRHDEAPDLKLRVEPYSISQLEPKDRLAKEELLQVTSSGLC
jgi:hypothetical protein